MLLDARAIRYGHSSSFTLVVERVVLERGMLLGVIGANGAGKTTLLRILSGLREPNSGQVIVDDVDLFKLPARLRARHVAWAPQQHVPTFDFTVEETVLHGRLPWSRSGWAEREEDRQSVERAIERMGLEDLRSRTVTTLSGGELQRAVIARALAQNTQLLVLDEPHAHLDVAHQVGALEALRREATERGLGVVLSLHDLNLAAMTCDYLIALRNGSVVAEGRPDEVLTEEILDTVYGVAMKVEPEVYGAAPAVRYKARGEERG